MPRKELFYLDHFLSLMSNDAPQLIVTTSAPVFATPPSAEQNAKMLWPGKR